MREREHKTKEIEKTKENLQKERWNWWLEEKDRNTKEDKIEG